MRFPVTEREGRSATAPNGLIPGGLTRGLCCEENEVKKTWQLVELHGCWWAYEGELPPPEAFTTHGPLPIVGTLSHSSDGRGAPAAASVWSRPQSSTGRVRSSCCCASNG